VNGIAAEQRIISSTASSRGVDCRLMLFAGFGIGGIVKRRSVLNLRSREHINVFVPEPVQSGGSNYDCRDYNPTGPNRINEVKVDNSAAA
jgi:hypothetical protein